MASRPAFARLSTAKCMTEHRELIASLLFFLTFVIDTRNANCAAAAAMTMTTPSTTSTITTKMNILCLHGRSQSGKKFQSKISGTRRKLERVYDLHFLDAPIIIPPTNEDGEDESEIQRAWWNRNDDGSHSHVRETFEYVLDETKDKTYDAILGFSQGGLLGTALIMTGRFPTVKAVLTAGSPFYIEPFTVAEQLANEFAASSNDKGSNDAEAIINTGKSIPKLHFAGATDALVPVSSVERLCSEGGSGRLIQHDKGHMFPTKAVYVSEMLDFLDRNLNA